MNRKKGSKLQTILEIVTENYGKYDFDSFTRKDVLVALGKDTLGMEDYAALLSPAAESCLEEMAVKAKHLTNRQFGNTAALYTPLYIANYCENQCVYCGFNCMNQIHRGRLTYDEMETEMETIAATGLREILILTGESRKMSGIEYIGRSLKIAKKYFTTIGIEIYPVDTEEYAYLQRMGADFVSVYQETYNPIKYKEVHLRGPKRDYAYRFCAQERALLGGMRGVGVGALLGLDDFRRDAFAAGLHAQRTAKTLPACGNIVFRPTLAPIQKQCGKFTERRS